MTFQELVFSPVLCSTNVISKHFLALIERKGPNLICFHKKSDYGPFLLRLSEIRYFIFETKRAGEWNNKRLYRRLRAHERPTKAFLKGNAIRKRASLFLQGIQPPKPFHFFASSEQFQDQTQSRGGVG